MSIVRLRFLPLGGSVALLLLICFVFDIGLT